MYGIEYLTSSSYNLIVVMLAFLIMLVGSVTDFQRREVADWVNYGLFFSSIALRCIFSVTKSDYTILLDGLFGFLIFTMLGLFMFYAGQWGGGDAKMIIGLGILFGIKLIPFSFFNFANSMLVSFFLNSIILGSFYGLFWSFILMGRNGKKFIEEWKKAGEEFQKYKIIAAVIAVLLILVSIYSKTIWMLTLPLAVLVVLISYSYVYTRSIERGCMIIKTPVNKLTEGDWIANEINIKGKYITGPKELGITKEQIEFLKKMKVKSIMVKVGIPFVPAFLLGFIATFFFGNIITYVMALFL